MKKYFSIGEAAKSVHTTNETLRHYDRIGLVKPSKKDEWTNYRYYTEQDIVRLNTVRALQLMELSLQEIKKVLEYNDLEKIVDFLAQAEKKADEKIAALQYSKSKIQLAKANDLRNYSAGNTTLSEWAEKCVEIYSREYVRSSTYYSYKSILKILPVDFCRKPEKVIHRKH